LAKHQAKLTLVFAALALNKENAAQAGTDEVQEDDSAAFVPPSATLRRRSVPS
jgi:hypothetical protein